MDPLTIITTALVAGAAAGGKDAASAAVRDAYKAVCDRIRRSADEQAESVLDANEADPGANVTELGESLTRHGIHEDEEIREAASILLDALPAERVRAARARIDLRGAQGVQIGDRNTQHNSFG